ncbi:Na+:solute symporter [Vibrio aestuarianus]|uniref:sodium:solute symporter family protein n=1 Tax=Vibrio aestuarianus TaxID=28171 RepID=UPI00237D1401|nr:sodium:solute symporter family protein [Vibrio aestuarianus]MDE1249468.1 Na+:solute symporter [Vibrio aestuarianus]MDE1265461.1 Na+:solute symporter [Vibrio aestuarianus]MDE1297588.1 Na+:solute symporter [Vibrio aestuarianus]MDE1325472.1 Na+:solute symporter [Vibrio aestuarianus]MDE1335227.1 Na+:solute symporter [Vibrio aestuarianus]
MTIDTIVVLAYFMFLIAIGWMFRKFTTSTSDYFRGGGKMLWWMVGATAFMTQFSAWTFTGAAGRAFSDGFVVVILFLANAFGYFMNYIYFAPKFRQLRVVTAIEAIRQRFGKTSEQFFTWAGMPDSLISAGIWLNGLAIFVAAVFDIPMEATIIFTGVVLVIMAVTGGSWAVVASDFMQMLVIMAVTITCAIAAYFHGGGIGNIVENFNGDFMFGNNLNYVSIFILWVVFIFVKQFGVMNNSINAYRYLCAKDSENARKAAGLACILMIVGPLIWFLPPWYVSAFMPDFAAQYASMGNKAGDAAYLAFVQNIMPAGMVGLLMSAMFAATMSSMDSGLNRNAGIFVCNFYQPILRKNATQKELVMVSKLTTVMMGIIIIAIGLFINSLRHLSLFDIVLNVGALIGFPMLIPVLLGMWVRKTPDWAGWTTLIVGGVVSYVFGISLQASDIEHLFGLDQALTGREWADLKVGLSLAAHVVLTGGFFLLTTRFYKGLSPEREKEVDQLFENWNTPLIAQGEEQQNLDTKQRSMLGNLICTAGFGILAMALIPNEPTGRLLFLLCGSIVLTVGILLVNAARKNSVTSKESAI